MTTSKQGLLLAIAAGSCNETIGAEEMGAMLSSLETGTVLVGTTKSQGEIGARTIINVLDSNGDVLVAGNNYMLRGKKVKVLRESFGAGNFLDTYYRVFYLDSDLEESFECIDAKFVDGPLGSRIYSSKFEPT
jgi:hypothetical protein